VTWKLILTHIFGSKSWRPEMILKTVIENLNNTIIGKEELLSKLEEGLIKQFISINIEELKKIQIDLKKVQETRNGS